MQNYVKLVIFITSFNFVCIIIKLGRIIMEDVWKGFKLALGFYLASLLITLIISLIVVVGILYF